MWIKRNFSSNALQRICSLIFFFLQQYAKTPRFPQRCSHLWSIIQINVPWGDDTRKLLSHNLADFISYQFLMSQDYCEDKTL